MPANLEIHSHSSHKTTLWKPDVSWKSLSYSSSLFGLIFELLIDIPFFPFRPPIHHFKSHGWGKKKKKSIEFIGCIFAVRLVYNFTNVSWALGIFLLCCCIGAGLHSYIISRLRAGNNCLMYFFILSNYHSAWQIIHVQCLFVEIKKTVLGHSNSTLHL